MWHRLGQVFKATGQHEWMQSHTAMPVPMQIEGDVYRIYFGTRDKLNSPSLGYIDINIENPSQILQLSDKPLLQKGPAGYFDDNGLYPGSIIRIGEKNCLYYMGRSNGENGLYYMSIGVAELLDNGLRLEKCFKAPILGRSEYDPWMTTTPCVIKCATGYVMYYASGTGWQDGNKKSNYSIKIAYSDDGIAWKRKGDTAICLEENETNICAPTIVQSENNYQMWFCYVNSRNNNYRIGYAQSVDGILWNRFDNDMGLGVNSNKGEWDSDCVAYPSVFQHHGKKYMVYSGNGNGKDGIGIAKWV